MVGITLRFFNNVRTKQADMNERLMNVESTVENMSTLNKTETDVGAVKESVEQISEKIGNVENTMDRVIDMKLDDMKLDDMKLDDMKLDDMKLDDMKLDDMKLDDMKLDDMKLDDMKEEQKEKEKRQNNVILYNVILYNVPEKLEGPNDKEVVENLILEELGVKEAKVDEITRLGTCNEPRPILLKLNDAQTLRKVLSKAYLLRNARNEMHRNIYLAPDKSIKEREKYRELQKELRERKERGQTDIMISEAQEWN